jgi:acyl-coenzyme A thioesterase PaaI-like protein
MEKFSEIYNHKIVKKLSNNHYQIKLTVTDWSRNKHKIVHGGIQSLMIDHTAFVLINDWFPKGRFVTTTLTVNYHKMIRSLEMLADFNLEHINNSNGQVSVKLSSMNGTLLTSGTVDFHCFFKSIDK